MVTTAPLMRMNGVDSWRARTGFVKSVMLLSRSPGMLAPDC